MTQKINISPKWAMFFCSDSVFIPFGYFRAVDSGRYDNCKYEEVLVPKPKNALEIFKHLEKSNCRECGEKTCLAFAGAVYQSRKKIRMCPRLDSKIVEHYSDEENEARATEETGEQFMESLKKSLAVTDLAEAAKRTGGQYDGHKLMLKVLGKDFGVDSDGNFISDIHINPWIAGPFLDYVINGKGVDPAGEWVSFRELKEGKDVSYPFFQKRCESAMKRVADIYTDLFDDLVHIFGGRKVDEQFESDISVVLHPLPKVPIMICYWKPEDGLASTLNLFFDKSADNNLQNGSILTICVGLALMLEKLSERHGVFTA
jgi:hypothetical protein